MENISNLNYNEKKSENKYVNQCNYIYFNFKYEKNKNYKICLSPYYKASISLELIEEKDLDYYSFIEPLIIKVYRFKIIPDLLKKKNLKDEFEIDVIFEEENKAKHNYTIKFKDNNKNFYEYKFKIEEINILPLELDEQFQIYSNILRNKYRKSQETKENEDFILSSLLFLKDEDSKYDLLFYLSIFLHCFSTDLAQNNLMEFDPKKIKGIRELPERRLKPIKNIINQLIKNPENIDIKEVKLRLETTKLFYSLALYFNLNFQKERIVEMFENEIMNDHLFEKLLSYHEYFKDLILPKEDIIKLIKKAKKYEQILSLFFYLGTDCYIFLEVVKEAKDIIYKFQIEEMNKNKDNKQYDNRIDIEKYEEPKKEDDIEKIFSIIEGLKNYKSMINEDMKLIKYSSLIIEKYSEFYDETNLDKLFILKFIDDSIKQMDKNFICKSNLDEKIHKTGLYLVKNGTIKNIGILNFIKYDIYFFDKKYNKKIYRPLEILEGINLSLIEDKNKFFKIWNKFNFYSMFELQLDDFLKKIVLLINEIKDFRYLFKLYQPNLENPRKQIIKSLQNRFIELLPTYNNKECPNFIDDAVELIYLSDKNKIDIKKFLLETMEKKLNVKIVNDIYINLTEKHKYLSKECNKIIVKYFTEYKDNTNPKTLADLINQCNNIRADIFSNLNKYILEEEDFFSLNESKNYIFFRELVNRKIIEKIQNIKQKYIIDTMLAVLSLQEKIKLGEIQFNLLYPYFKEGIQMEETLKQKISIIFFKDEESSIKYFEILKIKVFTLTKIKGDFSLICRYFMNFYPNSHIEDIKTITTTIIDLDNKSLNYFELNCKKEYNKYIKYLNEAEKGLEKKNSVFYNQILENSRKNYQKDDKKYIEETEKQFNELKNLFEKEGIDKIDENILFLCTKPFIEENDLISTELKKLMSLFKIFKSNEEIDNIKNDLILILKKEYFFNATSSIIFFIEQIGAQKGIYTQIINRVMSSLKNKFKLSFLKKNLSFLNNIGIDLLNEKNYYINILMKLNRKEEIIHFLFNMTVQECLSLQEYLSENNNTFISLNDLLDMVKCVECFKDLGKLEELRLKEDDEVINLFKIVVYKYGNEKILFYFINFIDNYNQIKELKSSSNKSIIKNLINDSTFIISNTKENSFQCNYKKNNKSIELNITKESIISIKEGIKSEKIIPIYKFFIENIEEILNISDMMNNIYMKGFPKTIIVKIIFVSQDIDKADYKFDEDDEINVKTKFTMDDVEIGNKELKTQLKNILINLKNKQIKGYQIKPLTRFLYGHQYNLLFNNINKENKNNNLIHLLKYITNDLLKSKVSDFKIEEKGEEDIIENHINILDSYLNELLKKNNLNLNIIYEKTIVKQKYNCQGIFIYLYENLEKDLFQIFKYLTGNNPIAQNILICNKDTTNDKITSFFYRSIKCELNSCFIIGGLESLENEQKECFIELLNNELFPNGEEKIKSCLILLFKDKNLDFYKNLANKKNINILEIKKEDLKNEKYEENNIEIIKSDISGIGKSTQIKKNIQDNQKKWIYFPIYEVFNYNEIIERLNILNIDNNSALHLDLYNIDNIDLMQEFLFSLLIARFNSYNEEFYYLSKDIPIKIEIQNTFIDFFEKLPILTLFNVKELKISDLPPLIVSKELDSNIQLVANYLKALKENKINDKDLIFPKITPKDFEGHYYFSKKKKYSTSVKADLLSVLECQNLIFDSIKEFLEEPTYYQIISFINMLAAQLRKLNQNYFLNAFQLITKKSQISLRTFIIKNFIEISQYFSEEKFKKLVEQKQNIYKSSFDISNKEGYINNSVNNIANNKHKVISFNNFDFSLIFFYEGSSPLFSIITNKNKLDKEYKDLLLIKNLQSFKDKEKIKELPDYKLYSQNQFLEELRNIFINNPLEKIKYSDKESLKEIAGNYIFTADNFLKMVLILLKIRANIPVIIMGETGCGKTSLIRKLSEIKHGGNKDKIKILNIHCGTTDNDICDFIYKIVIPEAIKIMEKESLEKINHLFSWLNLNIFKSINIEYGFMYFLGLPSPK